MIRRPPRSTLFPNTTLSRSARRLAAAGHVRRPRARAALPGARRRNAPAGRHASALREQTAPTRSEEHTSELQSRQYLVCRLLLEKKKKNKRSNSISATISYA